MTEYNISDVTWIHTRTGNEYRILGLVEIKQINKGWLPGFRYRAVDNSTGPEYVRTLSDFYKSFERKIL